MPEDYASVAGKIRSMVAEQAMMNPEDITDQTKLDDVGIDSLGVVEIVFAIEETFDISVPFNANDPTQSDFNITDVASIAKAVTELLQAEKGNESLAE